jgi:phosphohistidine phosphatase
MKTLLILRHAKSSWANAYLSDHDRPLKKRGKRDAPRMGRLLRDEDLVPDLIICSSAKRALDTAAAAAEASGYDGVIEVTRDFYHADPETYIGRLKVLPKEVNRVLIVGHNPGMEEMLEQLTGLHERMPTAALAQVSLPIEGWSDIGLETSGSLVNLWLPRNLRE